MSGPGSGIFFPFSWVPHQPRKAIKELRFLWKRGILKKGQKIPSMPAAWFVQSMSKVSETGLVGIESQKVFSGGWHFYCLAFGRFGDLVSSYPIVHILPLLFVYVQTDRYCASVKSFHQLLTKDAFNPSMHSCQIMPVKLWPVRQGCPKAMPREKRDLSHEVLLRPGGECELFFIDSFTFNSSVFEETNPIFFEIFSCSLSQPWRTSGPLVHPVFRTNRSKLPRHRPFPPWSARAMVCCSWRHGGALSTVPRRSP